MNGEVWLGGVKWVQDGWSYWVQNRTRRDEEEKKDWGTGGVLAGEDFGFCCLGGFGAWGWVGDGGEMRILRASKLEQQRRIETQC